MAGGRKEARQWALQILYQLDINPVELEEVFADFWEERNPGKKDRAFTEETVRGVLEHLPQIDGLIKAHAPDWEVKRLGGVDRNVIRIAIFEMLHRSDIPPVVSINEAVENAKDYSSGESARFVNGTLDEFRRTLNRPARTAYTGPLPQPPPPKVEPPPEPAPAPTPARPVKKPTAPARNQGVKKAPLAAARKPTTRKTEGTPKKPGAFKKPVVRARPAASNTARRVKKSGGKA